MKGGAAVVHRSEQRAGPGRGNSDFRFVLTHILEGLGAGAAEGRWKVMVEGHGKTGKAELGSTSGLGSTFTRGTWCVIVVRRRQCLKRKP